MMLPSYALYKKLYLLSFIILFYLSIVAEACCLLLEACGFRQVSTGIILTHVVHRIQDQWTTSWALSLARRLAHHSTPTQLSV